MGVGECFNGQFDFKIENSGGYVRFLKLLFTHKWWDNIRMQFTEFMPAGKSCVLKTETVTWTQNLMLREPNGPDI